MTPETQLVIRRIDRTEHDDVSALLVEAYATEWGLDGWDEYRQEMERVDDHARDALVLVAVRDRVVIGTVTLVPPASPLRSVSEEGAGEVRLLAVRPFARRQGVGQQLISEASSTASQLGLHSLVLQCDEDLAAAHRLYQGLGFERAEEHDSDLAGGYRALGYRRNLFDRE